MVASTRSRLNATAEMKDKIPTLGEKLAERYLKGGLEEQQR